MTVFQKIMSGELPAYKIYEDDICMAILDRFPMVPGQVVMFSKELYDSQFSRVDSEVMQKMIASAQKVAKLMEEKLQDVKRVIVVIEGMEVLHLHLKLLPVYNSGEYHHGVTGSSKYDVQESELAAWHQQLTS